MVSNITRSALTLTGAAYAADMPARALRTASHAVPPLGQPGRAAGSWRRYSLIDAVRLAVIGRLQAFGIPLPAAVEVLEAGVDRHLTGLALCGAELPASFLQTRLDGVTVHVVPGPDGLDIYAAPRGMAAQPAPAALVLDVGFIADDVIARLTTCLPPSTAAGAAISGTNV